MESWWLKVSSVSKGMFPGEFIQIAWTWSEQLLGHAIVLTMARLAALVRAHPDAASVVTLILLSFLALGRALLPGKVLSAADILFLLQPWKSLAPDYQPGNPLLSDAAMLFQPWLIYAAGEIGHGRIPLWNPHVFAGSPFFANPQSALLFPLTWIALLLPLAPALTLIAISSARLAMTGYGIVFYPWKWLWPTGLSPLYELPTRIEPLSWRFTLPWIVIVLATGLLVGVRRQWPAGLAAWTYSAIMVLPVIGPLHAGNQLAHDRYSYLSGLGFAVLAGTGLACVLRAAARGTLRPLMAQVGLAGAALVLLGLGSATWVQASAWRDSESLWSWALEADPECAICFNNLALAFMTRGQAREAEDALRRSLALREHAMTRNNLGGVLQVQGRTDEAEREYQRAVRLNSGLGQALANLGELYAKQGRYEDALPPLRRVFQISPTFPRVRAKLGESLRRRGDQLAETGRPNEAQALFKEALQLQP